MVLYISFAHRLTGEEMQVEMFLGVVYYQRLRHMVWDKYQVRSTGKNNPLTGQPVHGRKLGGGIRVGEMERDALAAHGVAYTLYERLYWSSDPHIGLVCGTCGNCQALKPVPRIGGLRPGFAQDLGLRDYELEAKRYVGPRDSTLGCAVC